MNISSKEKRVLINIVKETLRSIFSKTKVESPDIEEYPVLKLKAGVFVTLTIKGRLRGCIGYITSDRLLLETLQDAAFQAAMHDTRFLPLTEKELKDVKAEISILSPPFPMNSYDDIVIGKHGLILQDGMHRGLLLPQVPVEHGMNKEKYLDAICNKAGLSPDLWKQKLLDINMFTAEVFNEDNIEDKDENNT